MWVGYVESRHIAKGEGQPMIDITEAHTIPGRGIEGDRYFLGIGHFSDQFSPSHEITLIEVETIKSLRKEYDNLREFTAREARRNIVTRDVPLNHLVGRTFQVGEVILRGIRLCEPCLHIAELTHHNVLTGLIHRGGLRAQILTEGIIRIGDSIAQISTVMTVTQITLIKEESGSRLTYESEIDLKGPIAFAGSPIFQDLFKHMLSKFFFNLDNQLLKSTTVS
jgi:MOSC domain-containing protein YiiM